MSLEPLELPLAIRTFPVDTDHSPDIAAAISRGGVRKESYEKVQSEKEVSQENREEVILLGLDPVELSRESVSSLTTADALQVLNQKGATND